MQGAGELKFTQIISCLASMKTISVSEDSGINWIRVPFTKEFLDQEMTSLSWGETHTSRALNAMHRCNFKTVGDIVNYEAERGISKISSLGKQSITDIYRLLVNDQWDFLKKEDKYVFLGRFIELNS